MGACADDVGGVLKSIKHLPLLFPVFGNFAQLANLHLKLRKCKLCLMNKIPKMQDIAILKDFLAGSVPQWYGFDIVNTILYLGVWLGPAACQQQWQSPVPSWLTSAKSLAQQSLPASLLSIQYNCRIFSKLSYKSQFVSPPSKIGYKERGVLHSILKIPPQTFGGSILFNMPNLGGPRFHSLQVMNAAARLRYFLYK